MQNQQPRFAPVVERQRDQSKAEVWQARGPSVGGQAVETMMKHSTGAGKR